MSDTVLLGQQQLRQRLEELAWLEQERAAAEAGRSAVGLAANVLLLLVVAALFMRWGWRWVASRCCEKSQQQKQKRQQQQQRRKVASKATTMTTRASIEEQLEDDEDEDSSNPDKIAVDKVCGTETAVCVAASAV